MSLSTLRHGFRAWMPVFFEKSLFKASGIDTDTNGNVSLSAGIGYLFYVFAAAYVARVYTYLVYPSLCCFKREPVVKMNVRNKRHIRLLSYFRYCLSRLHIRDRYSDYIAAGGFKSIYLTDCSFHIPGLRIAHGLDRHGSSASDLKFPDLYRLSAIHIILYRFILL